MSLTGDPDGPPTKSGLSLVDLSGGYVSALALLAGLHRARRDGVGCDADISLFETALHQLMYVGTWTASGGYKPRRLPDSAHPSIVPFQAFATADGWITIACAKQKFWERLCEVLDRRDLLADPRFADFARARAPSRRTRAGSRRDPALLHDPGSAEVVERQRFALLAPVAEHRPPVDVAARQRTVGAAGDRPLRVLGGEGERDHAAHRGPVVQRAIDAERVEQAGALIGPVLDRVAGQRLSRAPVAARVEAQQAEVLAEAVVDRIEVLAAEERSAELQDQGRVLRSGELVVEANVTDVGNGHEGSSQVSGVTAAAIRGWKSSRRGCIPTHTAAAGGFYRQRHAQMGICLTIRPAIRSPAGAWRRAGRSLLVAGGGVFLFGGSSRTVTT